MLHRYSLLAVLFLFIAGPALAQQADPDKIFLTSGEAVDAVVTEVLPDAVKYRKWSNRTGPVYTVAKVEVHMILYANGEQELFREANATSESTASEPDLEETTVAAEEEPRKWWQPKRGTSSHFSLGFPDAGDDAFSLIFDITSNDTAVLAGSEAYKLGLGAVSRTSFTFISVEGYSAGAIGFLFGLNLMGEVQLSDRFAVFASYGAGPIFLYSEASGEDTATDFSVDFDDAISAGAAYWLSNKWGIHGKALIGNGDTLFTVGASRRF